MLENVDKTPSVVLCPECKTNQEGKLNRPNVCINKKCKKEFIPTELVPVIVWSELEQKGK